MKNGPYNLVIAPDKYPGKKYRGRYAYEHIVVFWQKWGQVPGKGFEVHHINGDHRDNRISNLQLVTNKEHRKLHGDASKAKTQVKDKCGYCLKDIIVDGHNHRFRVKTNKYKKVFCSRSCGAKNQFSELAGRS